MKPQTFMLALLLALFGLVTFRLGETIQHRPAEAAAASQHVSQHARADAPTKERVLERAMAVTEVPSEYAMDRRVVDLRGRWQFRLGDDLAWADPQYDDSNWDRIFVPGSWEDEGYPGYDGYAWYRIRFDLPARAEGAPLYLHLGRVDDLDVAYVNGHFVGTSGHFPGYFEDEDTAYHVDRQYRVSSEFLNFGGENVVAVRVYDERLVGGMVEGQVGLYTHEDDLPMMIDLAGSWQFRLGDDPGWRAPRIAKDGWDEVSVPGWWEPQGFPRTNGYAWYRKRFFVPQDFDASADLLLVLGRIDDLDEAFVNGEWVGQTGDPSSREVAGWEWQHLRVYRLPAETLRRGAYNTVAVRVYDGLREGGLYQGPVGIASAQGYDRWPGAERAPSFEPNRGFWGWLRDWLAN